MNTRTPSSASFAAQVAGLVLDLPNDAVLLAVTDGGDRAGIRTEIYRDLSPGSLEALGGFLDTARDFAAIALRTVWSPSDDIDMSDAWALVAVPAEGPEYIAMGRLDLDQYWTTVPLESAHWLPCGLVVALRNALAGRALDLRVCIAQERVMALASEDVRDSLAVADGLDVMVNVHVLDRVVGFVSRYVIPGAVGGPIAPVECSKQLGDAILELRNAMSEPGQGTWFVAEFTVTADNHVEALYDLDAPPSDLTVWPSAQLLAADLAQHPRTSEYMPDWMTAVLHPAA